MNVLNNNVVQLSIVLFTSQKYEGCFNLIMMKLKRFRAVLGVLCLVALIYLAIPDHSSELNDFGRIIYDRNGRILRAFLNSEEQWCFTPKSQQVPDKLKIAVLEFEDRFFYYHPGFNIVSIFNALVRNIKAGRVISGGSTITMQVCRIASPGKRTIIKKLSETLQAVKLEIKYSKDEILGFYLNNAPYGRNIKGVRAASLKYFQRELSELSWAESALLAVLPNEPAQLSPGIKSDKLFAKRNRLLKRLADKKYISSEIFNAGVIEPLPEKCWNLPQEAMHFTRMVNAEAHEKEVQTSLDFEIQKIVETKADIHSSRLDEFGIRNCSAMVADNESGKVLAWLGSDNYFNKQEQGEVDGVLAERSPGSTLKPFLYGLAIDEGLITPRTKIYDVPSYFSAYSPENSSGMYDGWVNADQALIRSLNIPAVRLLNLYGYENFYHWLGDAGITTLFRTPDEYGLTLILGGCEIKMLELSGLYMMLANYGEYKPITYFMDDTETGSRQLISRGSCWQILNTLSDLARPGNEFYWYQFENQWQLAWKTGTSYGNRDAWAVGVNPQYTIAVWSGNFDSESNRELKGASASAPLLFSIFNSLPRKTEKAWFEMPRNALTMRVICSETGLAPSEFCPKDTIFVPVNAKLLKPCTYHQPFQVTLDGKNTVCSRCWKDHPHETKVFLVYPPQVKKYQNRRGYATENIPPHLPQCPTKAKNSLSIVYPENGSLILLPRDLNGKLQKLSPQISVNSEETKIFWYLDDKYLGVSNGRENLPLSPDSGEHTLSIIDESGNEANSTFGIKLVNSE